MKKLTTFCKNLWKDESAQGATEYIILLIVVVALVILFKGKITGLMGDKLAELDKALGTSFSDVGGGGGQ
jgi:hypothetical protein